MPVRGTPAEDLKSPGREIREAREDQLELSADALGALLNFDGSHVRNVELGNTGYKGFAQRCEQMAGARSVLSDRCELIAAPCDANRVAEVLADLTKFLRSFASKAIDTRRGTERKQNQGRIAERLEGEWSAIWQTCRNGEEAWVAETVLIEALGNGRGVRLMNLEGGRRLKLGKSGCVEGPGDPDHPFRWQATCRITKEHWVNGEFTSLSPGGNVGGVFRLKVRGSPEELVGDWLGGSWDSERTHGLLILSRTEELTGTRFASERGKSQGLPHFPT